MDVNALQDTSKVLSRILRMEERIQEGKYSMLFGSMTSLWLFLPFILVANLVLSIRLNNLFPLAMSFIFYAWGEQECIWLLLLPLAVNYVGAMGMEAVRGSEHNAGIVGADAGTDGTAAMPDRQTTSGASKQTLITPDKLPLVALVAVNLEFLGYSKYFDFPTGLVDELVGGTVMEPKNLLLPVGVSFYTFQMISYGVGAYRGTTWAERNLLNLGLYMSFFPKMIQGPIERYQGTGACIRNRHVTPELFACGARWFIYGLGKKVILTSQFGSAMDKVLVSPMNQISGGLG